MGLAASPRGLAAPDPIDRIEALLVFACAKWGPVLRAPLEYRGFSIGTEWPVEKFGSSEIHRCTVGFPQTIS